MFDPHEAMKRIRIQIGTWNEDYVIRWTDAPVAYDDGGVLTVYRNSDCRLVLIPVGVLEWQDARYGSGMYYCKEDETIEPGDIQPNMVEAFHETFTEKEERA